MVVVLFMFLFPLNQSGVWKQASQTIEKNDPHQRQQRAAGQGDKKYSKIVPHRTLVQIELSVDLIFRHFGSGTRMTLRSGANTPLILDKNRGLRIFITEHLMHGFTWIDMAIQTIGNALIQKSSCLAVKAFAIGINRLGRKIMALH